MNTPVDQWWRVPSRWLVGLFKMNGSEAAWQERLTRAKAAMASNVELLQPRQIMVDYCPPRVIGSFGKRDLGPIWQYWSTGEETAPALIKTCMASVRRHAGGRRVITLSDATWPSYITLPPQIAAKRSKIGAPHFSELIRLSLLSKYGGTWIDASVMLTAPIQPEIAAADFFVFQRSGDPFILSSWFMHSKQGHPIIETILAGLTQYWTANDERCDYFLTHHLFEAAVLLHPALEEAWQRMPFLSAYPPHLLQGKLPYPFVESELAEICQQVSVHKLTYKFSDATQPGSFRDAIERDENAFRDGHAL